ncbi:aconitase family protein [Pseudoxanthomonas mexicana]
MSIEAGARAGMIAPDETTFAYVKGRPHAPTGQDWDDAVAYWRTLPSDEGAVYDAEVYLDAAELEPFVTWGTNPGQGVSLSDVVPDPASFDDPNERAAAERALEYMDLSAGTPLKDVTVDAVFMGSCTTAASKTSAPSRRSSRAARRPSTCASWSYPAPRGCGWRPRTKGLDKVFTDFGAEWRFAGCSMCLGMNPDQLAPGERCASTSNRNFEGRQGKGGRTHLVSPLVAAATAVLGRLASPSDLVAETAETAAAEKVEA